MILYIGKSHRIWQVIGHPKPSPLNEDDNEQLPMLAFVWVFLIGWPCVIMSNVWPDLRYFHGKSVEMMSLTVLGNYSARFWFNRCSICLWENPNPFISMISAFPDVSPRPNTIYFLCFETPVDLKTIKKTPGTFSNMITFCKYKKRTFWVLKVLEKKRNARRQSRRSV